MEASYLRAVGELQNPEAEESFDASSESRYERSADYVESVIENPEVGNILRYVWERWDGGGPHGLVGHEIPRGSRILRLMEFFVGELHICQEEREALEAVKAEKGAFDPELVAAVERMIDENRRS
jgi:HD-GYP domain-containing protein (c-di-GMP phosphodiesterase class II)